MRFIKVLFYLSFFIFVSCAPLKVNGDQAPTRLLTPSLTPRPDNSSTPRSTAAFMEPSKPAENYSIPREKARVDARVQSTLPTLELAGFSDKEITLLLVDKMLISQESKDVDPGRIADYQIEGITYESVGLLSACYTVTPSPDTLFINNLGKVLDDGRIRICSHYQVVEDNGVYKLLGGFSG